MRSRHRLQNEEGPSVPGTSLREITSTNTRDCPGSCADVKQHLVQQIRYVHAAAMWGAPTCRGRRDVFIAPTGNVKSSEALRIASCGAP